MAQIERYGIYLPKYRTPLGELQAFYGRPGRPRSKTLATPGLDEDTITMAYEAGTEVLSGGATPTHVITVTMSAPFSMKKMSSTVARALGLEDATAFDLGGHPGGLVDAFELAAALVAAGGRVLVIASDHIVSYEERVCDILSAGGAAAFLIGDGEGVATLGAIARSGSEVYDTWVLGTEAEPRYRLEVLGDAYAAAAKGALGALEAASGVSTGDYAQVAASQPHPSTLRSLPKCGVAKDALAATSFVGEIGNLGSASVGVALALALDAATAGDRVVCLGYGAGEGIAQSLEVTGSSPIGAADRLAGEEITLGTYYRWTRGRHVEPH
ncbi:MAG: hypothetical protein KDC36_08225 [Thermoleophilia bacterium]|nr:hypothetical protein [Thermoleophilia bacterium]